MLKTLPRVTKFRIPPEPPVAKAPKRPYSIVFSVNQLSETTQRQLGQLRAKNLSPSFVPVYYSGGAMDRVYIGAYASKEEALAELEKFDVPLPLKKSGPIVQKLPYALQVGEDLPAEEAEVVRVILKAKKLHVSFEDASGRMLLGAFRNSEESQAVAEILTKENILFRLVAR